MHEWSSNQHILLAHQNLAVMLPAKPVITFNWCSSFLSILVYPCT
jgi:hypothetical protein